MVLEMRVSAVHLQARLWQIIQSGPTWVATRASGQPFLRASLENSRSRVGGDAHIEHQASFFIPSAAAQRHLGVFGNGSGIGAAME
jgi:hypothetical protein